jgi:hypothetical protein
MKTEQTQLRCSLCERPTLHTRQAPTTNHVLHLLLTLVTLGIWLPIWFLVAAMSGAESRDAFRCTQCGQAQFSIEDQQREAMKNAIALALFIGFLVVMYFVYKAMTR